MTDVYEVIHFTHHGRSFRAELSYDHDYGSPWKEEDGHGPIRRVSRHYGTHVTKRPGERPMKAGEGPWLYDWQAAIKQAKEEGWGLGSKELDRLFLDLGRKPTAKQVRERAVQRDFDRMRGWLRDDWHYCVIGVFDEQSGDCDYLGGVKSDCKDYIRETIDEMASNIHPLAETEEACVLSEN